jgi:hypothetical protein
MKRLILFLMLLSYVRCDCSFQPKHDTEAGRDPPCPGNAYQCCPNLETWLSTMPCESPQHVDNGRKCYKKKHWACCVPGVSPVRWMNRLAFGNVARSLHAHSYARMVQPLVQWDLGMTTRIAVASGSRSSLLGEAL